MKTIRADVLDNYVVVYGADDAGEPKTFVIADDSSAYAVLRDAISSASEASPRASVGGAALETEVVEEIPTRPPNPTHTTPNRAALGFRTRPLF